MLSVNTNSSALSALRDLEANHRWLEELQTRVATGLEVSSIKDDPATYMLAQRMRGDLAGLNATIRSIDNATVTVDVATAATESISDVLIEMKGKMVSLLDAEKNGDTQSADLYRKDLDAYRETIKTMISGASFNGRNLIDEGNDIISALTNHDGSETLDFDHQNLEFGGSLMTLSDDSNYTMEGIEASINNVNMALSHFGTASRRLEIQKEFTTKLHNIVEAGVGRLVDADLAKTAAQIQAAQVKEQLGIIALNISNQEPRVVLSLFQN